ncbi:MAG: DUF294 nucleotidyltransferase-like domain-containing protein [Pseudomonadota bacterium]
MTTQGFLTFAARHHPLDALPPEERRVLAEKVRYVEAAPGDVLFAVGDTVDRVRLVATGTIDLTTAEGIEIQRLHEGDAFGAKPVMADRPAIMTAIAVEPVTLYEIDAPVFLDLVSDHADLGAFYEQVRRTSADTAPNADADGDAGLLGVSLRDLMTPNPIQVAPTLSIQQAASVMAEKGISCVLVADETGLVGMLTTGDMTGRVVARRLAPDTPVSQVMTRDPFALSPEASGFDALLAMSERRIGHLPIVEEGRPVGILTRTNLVRRQQVSAVFMIGDIARLSTPDSLAAVTTQVPDLLAQLVGSGVEAHHIGHIITSITDALTKRLVALAEAELGPPPVPYLWLACGSQGRREQTGISDQDNCLILDDSFEPDDHDSYFAALAKFVSDGLDAAGYYYCPGDMMATNPQWRQPVNVWRGYFAKWINQPDPMAQMLSSVMFDLRPIVGETDLFGGLQAETLDLAAKNSIFRAHMAGNSLKHTPPLGLFRGFALIRSGEHKDRLDLKHNGVVPIVDLARVYALEGRIEAVNTRERLMAAREVGTVSKDGGSDLIAAYDLIATLRLRHQAHQIRDGQKPDNFLAPAKLSALERNHLKDAFGVIKTLQSALGHGRSAG